jgi:LmbE family N-acetylglucosaminyl deacetylase
VVAARAVIAAARRVDNLLFFEPMPPSGRCGFIPQLYVDITDQAETKSEALKCYATQIYRQGRDLVETRRRLDAWRGAEIGTEMAEAFRIHRLRW